MLNQHSNVILCIVSGFNISWVQPTDTVKLHRRNSKPLQFQRVNLYDLLQDVVDVGRVRTDVSQVQLGQQGGEEHHHVVADVAQLLLRRPDHTTALLASAVRHSSQTYRILPALFALYLYQTTQKKVEQNAKTYRKNTI